MAVDSTHEQYDYYAKVWEMLRDTAAGEVAVKAAGTKYLPQLGGHDKKQYEAFKNRASFFNATARTIDGLTGMIFRSEPDYELPGSMEPFEEDVTLGGVDLQGFSEMIIDEILTVGRAGILVDFPRVEVGGLTQAEAERMNLRPFMSLYKAESIIDWHLGQIGNRTVLTQVRLFEEYSEEVEEFEVEEGEQIRVLDLVEDGGEIVYRQRLFRKEKTASGKMEWVQQEADIFPEMQGQRMNFIPFVFVGTRDTTPHVDKPPLTDLGFKNLDHYRIDADYKHSLHFLAAASTRWIKGVTDEEVEDGAFDEVGPNVLMISTSDTAEFGISEPKGQGIPTLRTALSDIENQLASLGARMLAPEKRQAEAAETAAIHRSGEISVLASLATAASKAILKALTIARDWSGAEGDVTFALNTDYLPTGLTASEIMALTKALQAGGISQETYLEALQKGEVIRPDLSVEAEMQRIGEEGFLPQDDEMPEGQFPT